MHAAALALAAALAAAAPAPAQDGGAPARRVPVELFTSQG